MIELVSVHTPKCAGISLRIGLQSCFREDQIYFDYDDRPADPSSPMNQDPDKFFSEASLRAEYIGASYRAVHGHFHLNKYRLLNGVLRTTCLREPIERLISHYNYWMVTPPGFHLLHRHVVETRMSLADFALLPSIRFFYTGVFFRQVDMDHFDLVGDYGDLYGYIRDLSRLLGFQIEIPHENRNTASSYDQTRQSLLQDRTLMAWLSKTLEDDIDFYHRFARH